MAVKAEFSADTSSFVKEVKKADDALGTFGKTSTTLQTQVKGFDSVLQQAGINVGPAAKAIDEIAGAAGKTATELGGLATAGLVVGTAIAAWEFGRAIAGFLGLDKAIADSTASLLGWGDVQAETAGAVQDTLDRAKALGFETTSYSAAIAFLTTKQKERLAASKEANDADEKTKQAMVELNSVGGSLTATLDTMSGTVVEAVKYYLAAGVAQGALATAYGLTSAQVKAIADSMKEAEAADKAWLEGMKAAAAEAQLYADVLSGVLAKAIKDTADADARAVAKLTAKTDAITESILAESAARESLTQTATTSDVLTTAWERMNKQLADLQKNKQGDVDITARQQVIYNEFTATQHKEAEAVDKATQAFWKAREAVKAKGDEVETATKKTGVYMQQLHMLVDDPKLAAFFGGNAQGAVATTLYSGGQAGITPEMAAAMAAGQFINTAGVGAVHINITQPLGTPEAIAKAVSGALTPSVLQGRKLSGL